MIGFAKVSSSADDAVNLGLLGRNAGISMNQERLIDDAKQAALSLAKNYTPGSPREDIKVAGEAGMALLKIGVWTLAACLGPLCRWSQIKESHSASKSMI